MNAAPRELRRPEYVDSLGAALERHGIEPSRVVVEVTESAAMDEAAARGPLERLHALGVGVAIDDFGEGFSSLSRLREMPVEQIKIDRSFMRDVPRSASASAVVTAIIRLAQALGREVVAEGVETEEQRAFLCRPGMPDGPGLPPGAPAAGGRGDRAAPAQLAQRLTGPGTSDASASDTPVFAVRLVWSLPSASITQMSASPSRMDVNASLRLSGDQSGSPS